MLFIYYSGNKYFNNIPYAFKYEEKNILISIRIIHILTLDIMELYKKAYKGVFIGSHSERWKITEYSMEEVLNEFMDYLNNDEEGIIEIHQIDIETKKRTIVKRIIIVNDFFLNPHEDIPLKF